MPLKATLVLRDNTALGRIDVPEDCDIVQWGGKFFIQQSASDPTYIESKGRFVVRRDLEPLGLGPGGGIAEAMSDTGEKKGP